MNTNEIFAELAKYRIIKKEAEDIVKQLEEQVKTYMTENGMTELIGDEHKALFTSSPRTTFDSTALKKEYPDIWHQFSRTKDVPRFTFA